MKDRGYRSEDISVVAKDKERLELIEDETDTESETGLIAGATTGGVLGGLTGLLVGIGALAPGVGPICTIRTETIHRACIKTIIGRYKNAGRYRLSLLYPRFQKGSAFLSIG